MHIFRPEFFRNNEPHVDLAILSYTDTVDASISPQNCSLKASFGLLSLHSFWLINSTFWCLSPHIFWCWTHHNWWLLPYASLVFMFKPSVSWPSPKSHWIVLFHYLFLKIVFFESQICASFQLGFHLFSRPEVHLLPRDGRPGRALSHHVPRLRGRPGRCRVHRAAGAADAWIKMMEGSSGCWPQNPLN